MIFRDGRLVDADPIIVPPSNVSGVFTTVGCEHGRPLLWDRHLARLQSSLAVLAVGSRVLDHVTDLVRGGHIPTEMMEACVDNEDVALLNLDPILDHL